MSIAFEGRLKKWGRSFGVIIPMEKVKQANFDEDEKIEVVVSKKGNPLKEMFGTVKFKRSTKEILDESDREAWDE